MRLKTQKGRLLKNTVMLYLLIFSNYLMSFLIVPYETRVLGPEHYGVLGLATAIMVYFQLFIDFGFLLSATAEVANHQDNPGKLSRIFTAVTVNKAILSVISLAVMAVLGLLIPRWREHFWFFLLFCVVTALNSLLPDYLYRGIERMGAITVRTVLIKLFFTLMVLIFVKGPEDLLLIPILQIIGNGVALVACWWHLRVRVSVSFVRISISEIWESMKTSVEFFLSRIAGTAYSAANTIVLDFISGGAMTAFYTSADKLITTAKSGLSPISDSLYPYMIRNRDFKLVKKLLLVLEPMIFAGCAVLFIWAEPLCTWFFGAEYIHTAGALRALLPIVVIILPSYIFGFPVLGAMGLNRHANVSVIVAAVIHVITLVLLYVSGNLTIVTLGIATTVTEAVVLTYRVSVVIRYRNCLKEKDNSST